jgi:hypothetical protein
VAPRVEAAASVVVGVEAARAVSGVVVVEVAQVVAAVSVEGEDEGVVKWRIVCMFLCARICM